MGLPPGSRLGPYEVLSQIGAGGMGEVYQARDTRLDRKVAVKVLAPELASDGEFRARFEREAKAISALNHPHICGLFDIGRDHDTEYLVLELLEGETLAARLERGPLPLARALRYGIEIADALEAAHRKGIVHRDLKPGNVMLTPTGTKLLDFGLAKHTTGPAGQALSMLATAPGTGTAQGTIIGTLQYMAPEQVQGLPADARTDIFPLGTLLYEMTTGRRAFEASTQASLIAGILTSDVPAVSTLAPLASPALDHVVQGCLAKEPSDRWQTAHDVKLELQWIEAQGSRAEAHAAASPRSRAALLPWAIAALACAALVGSALLVVLRPRAAVTHSPPRQFDLMLPPAMRLENTLTGTAVISPDGQHFVFEATVDGRDQLIMRDMASTALAILAGSDGGVAPFWSPDSRSVAFFHPDGQIKQVLVAGGPARVIADTRLQGGGTSGTWRGDVILFGAANPADGRIFRVPATGGAPTALATLPWKAGQRPWVNPQFLPDGQHFLIARPGDPTVYVASLDVPGQQKVLDDASSNGALFAAGRLFYLRPTGIFARPFDPERLEFSGMEVKLTEKRGSFSVSDDGTIVYRAWGVIPSTLTWFDRSGRATGTLGKAGLYQQVVLSPRGHRATVVRGGPQGSRNSDLWDVDLVTGIFSRLTTDPARDTDPSWSPDERALVFTSERTGRSAVFIKDLVTGKEEPLVPFNESVVVDQWTPDGRFVMFRNLGKAVYAMPVVGERTPRMLADTTFTEDEVHVSPDGRWVAYNADESGAWEVYVAAFPTFTSKRQISSGGGVQPQWRGDGRELFYLAPDGSLMSVRTDGRSGFMATRPERLFTTNIVPNSGIPQYAVTPDGQRFLAVQPAEGQNSFTFLINWLQSRMPAE
jgi:Tol biopolymer transport system component